MGFPGGSVIKFQPANAGFAPGFSPWVGKCSWRKKWPKKKKRKKERKGNSLLQYSYLENRVDRRAR